MAELVSGRSFFTTPFFIRSQKSSQTSEGWKWPAAFRFPPQTSSYHRQGKLIQTDQAFPGSGSSGFISYSSGNSVTLYAFFKGRETSPSSGYRRSISVGCLFFFLNVLPGSTGQMRNPSPQELSTGERSLSKAGMFPWTRFRVLRLKRMDCSG